MTNTRHTPLPWLATSARKQSNSGNYRAQIRHIVHAPETGMDFNAYPAHALGGIHDTKEVAEANATFIVKACNAHYELLEALKRSLAFAEYELELRLPSADPEYIEYAQKAVDTARSAIAKATGGAA
jgi:hypothetical protein